MLQGNVLGHLSLASTLSHVFKTKKIVLTEEEWGKIGDEREKELTMP
jgi:hypothetical protein